MNETLPNREKDVARLEAQKRVNKIKKFYKNLAQWAGTSVLLIAIDLFTSGGITWSKWPVFFWGVTVVMQVFEVIRLQRMDSAWEERTLRKHIRASDADKENIEDYSEELLRGSDERVKEKADLTDFRKVKKPWKDEDLV